MWRRRLAQTTLFWRVEQREREKETSFKDACMVKVHSVVFFLGNLRRLNAFTWHSEQQAGDVLRCQRVRR